MDLAMCVIAGHQGDCASKGLASIIKSIVHRGPDDSGLFVDDPDVVGVRRTLFRLQE